MASRPGVPVAAVSGSPVPKGASTDTPRRDGRGAVCRRRCRGGRGRRRGRTRWRHPCAWLCRTQCRQICAQARGGGSPGGLQESKGGGLQAGARGRATPGEAPLRPGPRRGWERQAVRSWAGFLSWLWVLWRGQGHRGPEHPGCARSGPHMGSSGQALRETEGLLPASKPGSGHLKPLPQPPSLTFHPCRPLPSQSLGAHPRGPRTGNAGFWGSPQAARSAGCVRKLASGATRRVRARNREVVDGTPGPGPPRPGGRAVPQFPRVKQGSWLLRPLGQSSGECARGRDLTVLGVCP